jgi:hypothetical protein
MRNKSLLCHPHSFIILGLDWTTEAQLRLAEMKAQFVADGVQLQGLETRTDHLSV